MCIPQVPQSILHSRIYEGAIVMRIVPVKNHEVESATPNLASNKDMKSKFFSVAGARLDEWECVHFGCNFC